MKAFLILTLLLSYSCSQQFTFEDKPSEGIKKFCFIGDTGTLAKGQTIVAKALLEENCHSIYFVGDIIYPEGLASAVDPQFQEKFDLFYKKVAESGNKPKLFILLGNHDTQNSANAWRELSKLHPYIVFPHPYYLVKSRDVCLIQLDTNYFTKNEDPVKALEESLWLVGLKNDLENCTIKIALGHHPFVSHGPLLLNSHGLLKWFLTYQVIGKFDFYIAGHEHILGDEGVQDGTRLLLTGAGGQNEIKEKAGYLVLNIEIKNEKAHLLNYEFKKIDLAK